MPNLLCLSKRSGFGQKPKHLAFVACSLFALGLIANEPGLASERTFNVTVFDTIDTSAPVDIRVVTGSPVSLRAEGDAAALDCLDLRVEGSELEVRVLRGMRCRRQTQAVLFVTVPALATAHVSGSGNMRIDRVSGPKFTGTVSGSGGLWLEDLQSTVATLVTEGSGDIVAQGRVDRLDASASGSGSVDANSVVSRTAAIRTSASGNVIVQATGEAEALASGSGKAVVRGGPQCRASSTGSGWATCL